MRKKVLSVLLCATLVAGIAVGCGSKSSSEKSSADAKKSDKKVITVGCEATTPGWIQTDEKGKLSGYDYDEWHRAHTDAARGECRYRKRCPVYGRSKHLMNNK